MGLVGKDEDSELYILSGNVTLVLEVDAVCAL